MAVALFACAMVSGEAYGKQKPLKVGKWVKIFDGKTYDGWRGYNKDAMPQTWKIEKGGIMMATGSGDGREGQVGGGDILWAVQKLQNFEMEWEWKSPTNSNGNSGFFYYVQEVPNTKSIYISAPEYQLGDVQDWKRNPKHGPASLFDIIAAEPQNSKPVGEWNKSKVVVDHGNVEHWMNGVKVAEYTLWTPEWIAGLQGSKFSERRWPQAYEYLKDVGGPNHEGFVGFQDHGHNFWFKNIRVKLLD